MRSIAQTLLTIAISLLVVGCGRGRPAHMQVQLCTHNAPGTEELRRTIVSLAASNRLDVKDDSVGVLRDAVAAGVSLEYLDKPTDLVVIWVGGPPGTGLAVTNQGLSSHEFLIGVFDGGDTDGARSLSEELLRIIPEKWNPTLISPDKSATPSNQCGSKGQNASESAA